MPPRHASLPPLIREPESADGGRRSEDWLNTARWRKLRREVLRRDGYRCRQTGVILDGVYPAGNSAVVDHIVPHRGDEALFWDPANLQAVAKAWHDREKQASEKRGEV